MCHSYQCKLDVPCKNTEIGVTIVTKFGTWQMVNNNKKALQICEHKLCTGSVAQQALGRQHQAMNCETSKSIMQL